MTQQHTCRTMWQLIFWYTGHSLEVIMACITEMSGAKTEEHSY